MKLELETHDHSPSAVGITPTRPIKPVFLGFGCHGLQSFPEQFAGLLHLLRISGSLYTDAEQVAFAPHQWLAAIH